MNKENKIAFFEKYLKELQEVIINPQHITGLQYKHAIDEIKTIKHAIFLLRKEYNLGAANARIVVNTKNGKEFNSVDSAAKFYKKSRAAIINHLKGRIKDKLPLEYKL